MSGPAGRTCPQCGVENAAAAARCVVCDSELVDVPLSEPATAAAAPPPAPVGSVSSAGPAAGASSAGNAAAAGVATDAVHAQAAGRSRTALLVAAGVVAIVATAAITFLLTGRSDGGDDDSPSGLPTLVSTNGPEVTDAAPVRTVAVTTTSAVARTTDAPATTQPVTTRPATTPAPTTTVPATTAAPATTATTVPLAPRPVPTPAPLAVPVVASASATSTRPDSTDACGNPTNYAPELAIDTFPDTAWMTPGDGSGQTLVIELTGRSIVTEVGLVPGYDKLDPCDNSYRFDQLRRVTAVRWTFDDGSEIVQRVDPSPGLKVIELNRAVVTSFVRMTIVSTLPPGLARLDHTAVSEVYVG